MFTKYIQGYHKITRVHSRKFVLFSPTPTKNEIVPQCNIFKDTRFETRNSKLSLNRNFCETKVQCSRTLCNKPCENLPNRCLSLSSRLLNTRNQRTLEKNSDILNVKCLNIVQSKYLHSVHIKQEGGHKFYQEKENDILYRIVSGIPELKDTVAPVFKNVDSTKFLSDGEFQTLLETDFSTVEKEEVLNSFKRLSFYMYDKEDSLSHRSFDNICQALINSIIDMSDDELCKLLYLLQIWSPKCFRTDKNYFGIFSKIDEVLIKKLSQGQMYYSHQQLLLLLDYWAHLNLLTSSNFCKLGLKKMLNKSHQLHSKEFVQLMYYHCRYRSFHPLTNDYDVEYNFEKIYDQLTPNEIAIVLLAFFKSEKRFVNSHLSVKNARIFINHVEELEPVCINGFLKSMKYYFPLGEWNVLYQVCDKLNKIIDSLPHQILPHAALVGTKIDVYHPELIDKIVEKAIKNTDILRIKDFEKILLPIALFNHKLKQPEFFDIISNEFLSEKRQSEINKYPKTLISLVRHLITTNHFNFELIEKCLDMNFLNKAFGKKLSGYVVPKDVLFVDFSVELEAPQYTGPRLPESLRHALCKHHAWRKPGELFHHKKVKSDELSITVQTSLEKLLGGEEFVHLAYILPHYVKPDVLVCLKDGKPIPIPESMSDFVHMNPYPPPAIGTWYAFIFITFYQLVNSNNSHKGPLDCKIRQLKQLGYEPRVVAAFEWLNETEKVREQMLRDKLGLPPRGDTNAVSAKQ